MVQTITAIYEDGVLKPEQPLNLPPHSQVKLDVHAPEAEEEKELRRQAWATLERLWRESPINSGGERLTRDELHERR